MKITGERLNGQQIDDLKASQEAHLGADEKAHLAGLRAKVRGAETDQADAQAAYDRAVRVMSLHGAADQARQLRAANSRLYKAQVDLRSAELALGIRDSGSRPASLDANNRGQGGPMPKP